MDLNAIQTTIQFLEDKIKTSSDDIKDGYVTALTQAQLSLTKMLLSAGEVKPDTTNITYKRTTNIKSIENALNETTFNGCDINETTRFIERLEKVYMITVSDVDVTLATDFLKLVKLRLSDAVFKNLIASKVDVTTFDKLKQWLKTTYGGNFNAFQILQRAWDIEFKPEDKFAVYAQKVSEELRTGLAAIQKQHKEINGSSSTLSNDATMEFVAGLLVSNNLRAHCWPIFKDMVNDMDKMMTSTEVANKAEYYRERLGNDFIGSPSDTFWAKPKKPYQNQPPKDDSRNNHQRPQSSNGGSQTNPNYRKNQNVRNQRPNGYSKNDKKEKKPVTPKSNVMHSTNDDAEPESTKMNSVFSPTSPFQ